MKLENIIAKRKNKTVYREGNLCYKVFDETYSKADILNEALNQARVEETGLNIPKIREITMIDGKWAIVTDHIEGKTLSDMMRDDPENIDAYLERFVDIQLEVQGKSCPLLRMLRDKMNRKICETNFDATTRYDLHMRLEAMPRHAKLCHGDFNPSNIIITEDGTPYVLDWSHATQGNGSADAARTYLLFRLAGETEAAEKYMKLFCEKSNTEEAYVRKWLPIVAASQSVKGIERERDFLREWVNTYID
ncbi:MAG: phosphotransferase [Clostridia bacterium]|nr:phosphotransferase [Clostridia bacterium]